jgi:hypothetical protein
VPLAGSDPLAIYRLSGAVPVLPDERAITPVAFQDGRPDDGLQLDAVALMAPNTLRLLWTVLGTTSKGATPMGQRVTLALQRSDCTAVASAWTECNPTAWHAGDTVFTWLGFASLPDGATLAALARAPAQPESLLIGMWRFSQTIDVRSIGPLRCIVSGWPAPVRYSAMSAAVVTEPSAAGERVVVVSAAGVTMTGADLAPT